MTDEYTIRFKTVEEFRAAYEAVSQYVDNLQEYVGKFERKKAPRE